MKPPAQFMEALRAGGTSPFHGLSRTEVGIHSAESHAQARATCGREAVKSVLRLFDELVRCDEEEVLKGVSEVIAGS